MQDVCSMYHVSKGTKTLTPPHPKDCVIMSRRRVERSIEPVSKCTKTLTLAFVLLTSLHARWSYPMFFPLRPDRLHAKSLQHSLILVGHGLASRNDRRKCNQKLVGSMYPQHVGRLAFCKLHAAQEAQLSFVHKPWPSLWAKTCLLGICLAVGEYSAGLCGLVNTALDKMRMLSLIFRVIWRKLCVWQTPGIHFGMEAFIAGCSS